MLLLPLFCARTQIVLLCFAGEGLTRKYCLHFVPCFLCYAGSKLRGPPKAPFMRWAVGWLVRDDVAVVLLLDFCCVSCLFAMLLNCYLFFVFSMERDVGCSLFVFVGSAILMI